MATGICAKFYGAGLQYLQNQSQSTILSPCADMPNISGKILSLKIEGHYQLHKTELSSNIQTCTFVLAGELWHTYC